MRDIELYRTILGLTPPWAVASVDLDVKGQQVVVKVDAGPGPFEAKRGHSTFPAAYRPAVGTQAALEPQASRGPDP